MTEFIDKQKAIDAVTVRNLHPGIVNELQILIISIPAADVQPVRHGRWIIDREFGNDVMSNEQMVICSECGLGIFWGKQPYCPNCGAHMMDGGESDER